MPLNSVTTTCLPDGNENSEHVFNKARYHEELLLPSIDSPSESEFWSTISSAKDFQSLFKSMPGHTFSERAL